MMEVAITAQEAENAELPTYTAYLLKRNKLNTARTLGRGVRSPTITAESLLGEVEAEFIRRQHEQLKRRETVAQRKKTNEDKEKEKEKEKDKEKEKEKEKEKGTKKGGKLKRDSSKSEVERHGEEKNPKEASKETTVDQEVSDAGSDSEAAATPSADGAAQAEEEEEQIEAWSGDELVLELDMDEEVLETTEEVEEGEGDDDGDGEEEEEEEEGDVRGEKSEWQKRKNLERSRSKIRLGEKVMKASGEPPGEGAAPLTSLGGGAATAPGRKTGGNVVVIVGSERETAMKVLEAFKPDTGTMKLVALDGRTERIDFQVRTMQDNAELGAAAIVVVLTMDDAACVGALCDNIPNFLPSSRNMDILMTRPVFLVGATRDGAEPSTLKSVAVFESQCNALRMMTRSLQYCEGPQAGLHAVARTLMGRSHVATHPKKSVIETKLASALLTNGQDLSLRKLQLSVVPYEVAGCEFLRKLRLNNNQIKVFPAVVLQLRYLIDLDLSFNIIEIVPVEVAQLKQLSTLDLSSNKIAALPSEVEGMQQLKTLKLSGNPIQNNKDVLRRMRWGATGAAPSSSPKPAKKVTLKKKKKEKPTPVFGSDLSVLLQHDQQSDASLTIPTFARVSIKHIITTGLNLEGVFRVAAGKTRQTELVEHFNDGGAIEYSREELPATVSALLKQFLRDMPEPLFTWALYEDVLKVAGMCTMTSVLEHVVVVCFEEYLLHVAVGSSQVVELEWGEMREALVPILAKLPEANMALLHALSRLMFLVSQNNEVNRMDASNIAKVVGPNVLYSQGDGGINLSSINAANELLTQIILNYPELFEKPQTIWKDHLEEAVESTEVLFRKRFGHTKSVSCTALVRDHPLLWTGDSKGVFRIWNTDSFEVLAEVDTAHKCINTMQAVGETVWLGTRDNIEVRDAQDGTLRTEFATPTYNFCLVGEQVWVGDAGKLMIYDTKPPKLSKEVPVQTFVNALECVGDRVWGACGDRRIRVWDSKTHEMVREFDSTHENKLNSLTEINGFVWTAADDAAVKVWDAKSFECVANHTGVHGAKVFGTALVGSTVWSYSWDREIHIWDAEKFNHIRRLPHTYHDDAVSGVVAQRNEKYGCSQVISSSWDRSIVVWLVRDEKAPGET